MTAKQRARMYERFEKLEMHELVRAAEPIARVIVLGAIDRVDAYDVQDGLSYRICELLGVDSDREFLPDDERALPGVLLGLRLAFALGVTTGQLGTVRRSQVC